MTRPLTINNNLTVSGDIKLNNSIKDSSGSAGTNGYVLTSTGTGWNWAQSSGGRTQTMTRSSTTRSVRLRRWSKG